MAHILSVPDPLVTELAASFDLGPMLTDSGMRSLNEEQIARFSGLSIQIYADEHPPPHFHVRAAGEEAAYALDTGHRLEGMRGLERFDRNIRKWWRDNRCELILFWNGSRPADCPVGPVAVPPECLPQEHKDQ